MKNISLLCAIISTIILNSCQEKNQVLLPSIDGDWWQVAGDPDLGEYTSSKQQPVDFGVWQAADGTWQLWSCIRHTNCGGNTRLFYRWEGESLIDPDWKPMGIEYNDLFYCYYMGHTKNSKPNSAIFCRTSADIHHWSEPVMVSGGGSPAEKDNWYGGDAECPFVVNKDGLFYLFRNQRYGENNMNTQYGSPDPQDFGVDDDRYLIGTLPVAAPEIIYSRGEYYIAALLPNLKGIRMAKIKWVKQ